MEIRRPKPAVLELRKSRLQSGAKVTTYVVVLSFFYYFLFSTSAPTEAGPIIILFLLAPLFSLPEMIRHGKVLTSGEIFTIDGDRELIEKDGSRLSRFDEVERIQIRVFDGSDDKTEYRLSLVLTNEEKIRVEQSSNYDDICAAADDIADILGVEVTKKGKKKGWAWGKGE